MTNNHRTTPLDSFVDHNAPICYGILKPGEHNPGGIPVIKVKNIVGGKILEKDLLKTSPHIHAQYKRAEVKHGDLLLTIRGTTGRVAIVPESLSGANITQDTARIRVSSNDDPLYVFYALHSPSVQQQIDLNTVGQAVKGINIGEVKKLKIFHPPRSEQKKIAQILSIWDKAINTTEKLLANSQQQKKALMQQLLTGKKRLLDENGARFSGEWRFINFDNLFKVNNKKSAQVKSSDYLEEGAVPVVDQGKQLIVGYCNNEERYIDVPVIIFGDHTRCLKWVDFEFCPGADGTQVLDIKGRVDKKFGYYSLCFTDIPNLGYSRHMRELREKDFKVPLNTEEQRKVSTTLSAADQEITAIQRSLDVLKQEKKALMQQLLTGKRRVSPENWGDR